MPTAYNISKLKHHRTDVESDQIDGKQEEPSTIQKSGSQ